jgi:3-keto-5-aminohexanoate cleavage enzyme
VAREEFRDDVWAAINPKVEAPPIIITVALTGAVPEKSKYPTLPTEPEEIAEQALVCAELGASTVHLHMRDERGIQVQDSERLLQTLRLIRAENPDLVICATTTSRGSTSLDERLTPLTLPAEDLPDMVSLTMGSYNTPIGINANPYDEIEALSARMMAVGVAPELEVFEPGMLYTYFRMRRDKKISTPAIINILLGVDGASAASPRELIHMVDLVPRGVEWAVAGIGSYQKPMVWLGALLGGNVRVGMEDDPRGEHSGWSNTDSVARAVRIAHDVGRGISTTQETRERLNLPRRNPLD